MDNMSQLFGQQGLRSMHLSYSKVLESAMKGDKNGFVNASQEFMDKINSSAAEFEFTAKVLTDPKYLATLPKEHRENARQYGEHAGRFAKELKSPDGLTQRSVEFLATACDKPDDYMKLVAERTPVPSLKQDIAKKNNVRDSLGLPSKLTRTTSLPDLGEKPTEPKVDTRPRSVSVR